MAVHRVAQARCPSVSASAGTPRGLAVPCALGRAQRRTTVARERGACRRCAHAAMVACRCAPYSSAVPWSPPRAAALCRASQQARSRCASRHRYRSRTRWCLSARVVPAPPPALAQGAAEPLALRLPFDGVTASPGLAPGVDNTQQAEGPGCVTGCGALRATAVDHRGLFGVDLSPVRRKAFRQHLVDPPSVLCPLAAKHTIVRVAVDHSFASTMGLHHRLT